MLGVVTEILALSRSPFSYSLCFPLPFLGHVVIIWMIATIRVAAPIASPSFSSTLTSFRYY